MRVVLAILFSLALLGTPFRSDATAPCIKPMPRACCHGTVKMACCDVHPASPTPPAVPATQPAPLNPAVLFTAVAWTLPDQPAAVISSDCSSLATGASLYTRHCALLL